MLFKCHAKSPARLNEKMHANATAIHAAATPVAHRERTGGHPPRKRRHKAQTTATIKSGHTNPKRHGSANASRHTRPNATHAWFQSGCHNGAKSYNPPPGHEETLGALRDLLVVSSLLNNLHHPTQKLLEKRRENARRVKRFEKEPKTPAQRVLESPDVCEADKQRVRGWLSANDFLTLRRRKEKLLFAFTRQDKLLDSKIRPVGLLFFRSK